MVDRELVIKIPEESYTALMEIKDALQRTQGFEKFIVNGTPLSKGHGRLVDADILENEIDWLEKTTNEGSLVEKAVHRKLMECISIISSTPTIIEADDKAERESDGEN